MPPRRLTVLRRRYPTGESSIMVTPRSTVPDAGMPTTFDAERRDQVDGGDGPTSGAQ